MVGDLVITHVCAHDPSVIGSGTPVTPEDLCELARTSALILCKACSDATEAGQSIDLVQVDPIWISIDETI